MSDRIEAFAPLADKLDALLARLGRGQLKKDSLERLTGGANQETWAFDASAGAATTRLVMRRLSRDAAASENTIAPETEAEIIRRAGARGVPTAPVIHILEPNDGLGRGFISGRIEGETVGRRILREPQLAAIRPKLAHQCGATLAHIHAVPTDTLPALPTQFAAQQIDELYRTYHSFGGGSATFELAFRWLREHLPAARAHATLVHGDFRNGNLIVGSDGIRAVLDWELAHLGDPAEDFGWITVNSWRFGAIDKPVGGFGSVAQLLEGYRSAGGAPIDEDRVMYWRTLGSLRWGLTCRLMARPARPDAPLTVERAMIGRRVSEAELDLLDILVPESSR